MIDFVIKINKDIFCILLDYSYLCKHDERISDKSGAGGGGAGG